MKTLLTTLAVAAATLFVSAETAQAQWGYYGGYPGGFGVRTFSYNAVGPTGSYGYGYSYPGYFPSGYPYSAYGYGGYSSSSWYGLGGVDYGYFGPGYAHYGYTYPGYYYRPGYFVFFDN